MVCVGRSLLVTFVGYRRTDICVNGDDVKTQQLEFTRVLETFEEF